MTIFPCFLQKIVAKYIIYEDFGVSTRRSKMKLILMSTIALLIFATPVFSELTVTDFEKIRSIAKASEDRLKSIVKASEDRLKSIVKASEDRLKEDLKASENRLTEHIDGKVDEMDKRLNMMFGFVVALISLIVIVVGIPQIIMVWRSGEARTQKREIQELRQEIELLKQQRT